MSEDGEAMTAIYGHGQLALLATGNNTPAGVLTWDGWNALRDAQFVYARQDLAPDWEQALAAAGIAVHTVPAGMPAAELSRRLLAEATEAAIVWFGSPDGDPGLAQALTTDLLRLGADAPELELVLGSWDEPGSGVTELTRVMDQLRSPGGCPWDAEQTHESLVPYALEEAYEVAEAIEAGTRDDLVEELGDLLLQVVFHARLGEEAVDPDERFDLDDVAAGITAKLRRRHPHVFADVDAPTAAHVEANWEAIKKAEKGRESVFDGVPAALPALARAQKVAARFARAGLVPGLAPASSGQLSSGQPSSGQPSEGRSSAAEQVLALAVHAAADGLDLEAAVRAAVRDLEQAGRTAEGRSAQAESPNTSS